MAVFLTGDTHGEADIGKMVRFAEAACDLTRDDALIILGDFGLVWKAPASESERSRLDWLEAQPFTTYFVDGNHENFDLLDAMPVAQRCGGRVHEVRPHVIHLMRGEIYLIGGHSFFVAGGGHSIDRVWRTPHLSWWEQEVPSRAERYHIAEAAKRLESVDYELTDRKSVV